MPTPEASELIWIQIGMGVIVVLTGIVGWFTKDAIKSSKKTAEDLADHKLHVSENYVKQSVIAELKVEQINAVNRLHERIDVMGNDIKDMLKAMGVRK